MFPKDYTSNLTGQAIFFKVFSGSPSKPGRNVGG